MEVPENLQWLNVREDGRAWLERLPALVAECAEAWGLTLGAPFQGGMAGLVLAARQQDGTPVVLKVQFPHRECAEEGAALRQWDGNGAVRLLAQDMARHALLLERVEPGQVLARELEAGAVTTAEALGVFVNLCSRLWSPAGPPFRPLADEAAWWLETMEADWAGSEKRIERRLLDAAQDALRSLAATQGEQVLVHQDFHAGNVLRATREPWLAIDPKPLAGEREFGVAGTIRDFELGHSSRELRYRLDRLSDELSLDRERTRLWAVGQTVAWSLDSDYTPHHHETATWLLDNC